jgi:hypothetical protein
VTPSRSGFSRAGFGALGLAALGLAFAGPAAWAAGPTDAKVKLVTEACPEVDADRLGELVAIELGTVGAGRTLRAAMVGLACAGERIAITATDAQTGRQSHSEVLARDTAGPALLRLLAISVSELVATSEVPVDPRVPLRPEPAPVPQSPPARRFRATAAGSVRRVARPATWLGGVALGAELAFARYFALAIEGRGELGSTATRLTTVDWQAVSASAALLAGAGRGPWRVEVGLGMEGGFVKLAAHDTAAGAKGNSLSGPWAGPIGRLRVIRALGARAFVLARIDGGWIMQRVAGDASDGSNLVELRGGWAGLTLGAGLLL